MENFVITITLLLIPLGNTSFFGIPMVRAFFGEQAIPYSVIYDQLGSFLALATYGSLIIAFYGSGEGYPTVMMNLLTLLSSTLIPLVMIAVGFQLSLKLNREIIPQLLAGLSIKLLAAPIIAIFLFRIAGLSGEIVNVSIFEAAMPPMVSAGAMPIMADLSPKLTAVLVGIGIVLSFITLPLIYQLL